MTMLESQQLRDTTKRETAGEPHTAESGSTDVGVADVSAGIADVVNMRVGCWRAPVHFWTGPTAA